MKRAMAVFGAVLSLLLLTAQSKQRSQDYKLSDLEVLRVVGVPNGNGQWRIQVCAQLKDTDGGTVWINPGGQCVECVGDLFTPSTWKAQCAAEWARVNSL